MLTGSRLGAGLKYRVPVGFLNAFRSRSHTPADPPFELHLEERRYETDGEDGQPLHGYGYVFRDEHERALSWDDPLATGHGIEVVKVAGTSHRFAVLQDDAFAPGSPLSLRPEPKNKFDRNAVGIWDKNGRLQVGYVPAEQCEDVARRLRRERVEAYVLWEWRNDRGERCGLRMLVCPPGALAETPRPLRSS